MQLGYELSSVRASLSLRNKRLLSNALYVINALQCLLETLDDILRLHIARDQEQLLSTKQKSITLQLHVRRTRSDANQPKCEAIYSLLTTRAVVETDSSETKTKTETVKFFRDQDRDQDRSRSQFWLRDRDRQSSRPRPRPKK